ncbi:metallophosphoesterase [Lysobacter sp. N42]|uniref:metallophosphoesterase n=1 Tax=Lysobacter sp. N42 TaxID=2545719 RepID=UPI00104500DF|nr:metallophosphoesterase [Lysobacter sp. N42]TCZ86046.1 metallophosphoesterase [Lysobacter sp. N42]
MRPLVALLRRWPWLRRLLIAWIVAGLAVGVYGLAWEPGRLVERPHALSMDAWPAACDGLRIDHVSDIHTGSPHNGLDNLDRIVDRLVASDAQAVVMTGDYVILSVFLGTYVGPEPIARRLRRLTARKPVYAVLGNHDWWKNGQQIRETFASAGVVMLEDEARHVTLGGCPVWIVGIGDLWEARHDVAKAFSMVAGPDPAIAITHNPALFPQMPSRGLLMLAGHTHGGQISLPGVGQPAMWGKEEGRYVVGHYEDDGQHLFVSPGIGTSIVPVRIGMPPEISRLTLRARR